MKLIHLFRCHVFSIAPKQMWRTMKLIIVIITVFLVQASAAGFAQQVTLKEKSITLKRVFTEIRKQTGYTFVYKTELINNTSAIQVNLENVPLEEALKKILTGKNLLFTIDDKTIRIKEKEKSVIDKVMDYFSTIDVTGKVMDVNGLPLSGASVKVKGTAITTTSNEKGEFALNKVEENAILLISYIGYETKEISASSSLTITMVQTNSKLDEVQIIAYGTTTRRLNTGSVSTVKAKDIENQPVSNPLAALQGRVPGLVITQVNGLPGSAFTVQIRGRNSISQGTEPLYIIDGVPFDNSNPTQVVATGSINVNNPMNAINPADIESIDVLKDADATSIYGSRGANGVILITTKKGKAGTLNFNMDAYTGWSRISRTLNMMNGAQFRQLRREAFANDGITPTINNAPDLFVLDSNIVNNWEDILFGKTATTQNLNFRISGGGQNTQLTAGAGYNHQVAVYPIDNSAGRKSLNFSIHHNTNDNKFAIDLSTSYANNNSNLSPFDLTSNLSKPPYGYSLIDKNGNLVWDDASTYFGNPLSKAHQQYNGQSSLISVSGNSHYNIVKNLKLKLAGGFTESFYNENALTPLSSLDPRQSTIGFASFANNKLKTWSLEPQAEYNTVIRKKVNLTALIGLTFQEKENRKDVLNGSGYTNDALINTIAGASAITASNDYALYKYNAGFARLSLDYNKTYLLNLTGRRDGSSRFGTGNQFANFGSIGAAWILTNLKSIKDHLPWISFSKLRASYGTVGNDQIGDYKYLDSYTAATNGYQQSLSLQPTRLFNKNYSWEQFNKFEAALELGFLKDRIYTSIAFYQNRSANQLISYSLPTQTGFSSVTMNFPGEVENKGWEFEIRSDNFRNLEFKWNTSINLSIPRNKLLAYPGLENSSFATSYVVGESLNVRRGYQFLGVDPQTGIYKFVDQNNDGKFDTNDYINYGTTDPKFYGGLQNSLQFKGFTLDFLFQFVKQTGKNPVYGTSAPLGSSNLPIYAANYWKKPGDLVPYAKPTQLFGTELYTSYSLMANSNGVQTDASFIRLKTLSVSYSLPKRVLSDIKLKSFSAYMEGQNLWTITNYLGPDPEVQSTFIMPPLRTIAIGIRAGF